MKTPPLTAWIKIGNPSRRSFRLWIPLFLVWLFGGLFFLLALPFLFLAAACFLENGARKMAGILASGYAVLCALRGLTVDVSNPYHCVYIRFP